MSYNKTNKPTREDLAKLLKNHTNLEAARKLGVSGKTVQRWRNEYGLSHEEVQTNGVELNEIQKDLLIAWMLGDGCVRWSPKSQKNCFSFKQMIERKEYVQFVYDSLLPFSSSIRDSKPAKPRKRCKKTGKIVSCDEGKCCLNTMIVTHRSNIFKEMRHQWYADPYLRKSQKIVPDLKLNWRILAYWFADDGNNNAYKKTINLATNSFREEDVDKLICWMKRDLGLEVYRQKGPTIVFKYTDYDFIITKLKEHLGHLKCLESKLEPRKSEEYYYRRYNSSLSPEIVNLIWQDKNSLMRDTNICKKYGISKIKLYRIMKRKSLEINQQIPLNKKITNEQILQIIEMWNAGEKQAAIAKQFNIQQTLVSQIVRRKVHKEITKSLTIRNSNRESPICTSGSAIVSVIYNPVTQVANRALDDRR